jgi:hypothetical protein
MSPEAQAALQPLCDEIVRLYHAERTFIRPARFPEPQSTSSLSFGRPVAVSSTLPQCAGSEACLTDGILAQDPGDNFWAHDAAREKTAWVVVDLGAERDISEVRVQFRHLDGVFWFVPSSITIETSDIGAQYVTVTAFPQLPKEGAPYSPDFWRCPVSARGRYVRLLLGPSQHTEQPLPGTLELTEIEIEG